MRIQRFLVPLVVLTTTTTMMALIRADTISAEPPRDDAVKREMKALQGRWQTVDTEVGGKHVESPGGHSADVVIEGDHRHRLPR
jgi:hypothetical protein